MDQDGGATSARSGVYVVDRGEGVLVYVPVAELFPTSEVVAGNGQGEGPSLGEAIDVAVDAESNVAYVLGASGTVLKVSLETGDRVVTTSDSIGAGPGVVGAAAIATGPAGSLWLLAASGVWSVDVESGDRELFWEPPTELVDAGSELVEFDVATTGDQLMIVDQGQLALLEVSLTDGSMAPVSGGGVLWPSGGAIGTGPQLLGVVGLVMRPDSAFVLGSRQIFRVDLATGDRSVASGSVDSTTVGEGVGFAEPRDLVVSNDGAAAFVLDGRLNSGDLWRVELPSGDRSFLNVKDAAGQRLLSDPTGLALVP